MRLASLLLVLLVALPGGAAAQLTEADVHLSQGLLDLDAKRYEEALTSFRRALEIQPDHPEALYYAGVIHMIQRRVDEAVPLLERARARLPRDPAVAYQLGLAYFARQQYGRAQELFEEAFMARPDLDGLGYYLGLVRYRTKDYRGALNAFRAGRASDPEIQQLTRFYSGLALGVLGLTSQALAEVEQSLRLAPGSAITGPAERLRESLAARPLDRLVSAEVRVGFFVDDNVPVVPDPDGSEPLVGLLRDRDTFSTGEFLGARLSYAWLRHLLGRDDWDGTIELSFFGNHNNSVDDFDILNPLIATDLAYRTAIRGMPAEVRLAYAWDALFLDGSEFLQRHSVLLAGTLVESERHLTQLVGRYQHKDFDDRPLLADENRDADNWMVGLVHVFRFAQDVHYVKLGYQFDYEDARGRNYEYHGHRLLAGAQYTLPWGGVRLKYDIDAHLRDYRHHNTILPSFAPGTRHRRDREITQVARVEIPLPWLAVPGSGLLTERSVVLTLEYQRIDGQSNLAVFDYTRNLGSIFLTWLY